MNLNKLISDAQPELVARLQECVRFPSVLTKDDSGYPFGKPVNDCLKYMLSLADSMGFRTHNMDDYLGWCEYGEGEEMVAVLAHLDVVPEGDGWSVPPYEGRIQDGRIYGRGTMDDKGPCVSSLFALKALKDSGLSLKRRVRLIFGCNEETGSADMAYYNAHGGEVPVMGFTPDGEYPVINGEKGLVTEHFACQYEQAGDVILTELWGGTAHNIVPNYAYATLRCSEELAQKICGMSGEKIICTRVEGGVKVEAAGVGAHGGTPWEGENAIGRLMLFLAKLPLEGGAAQAVSLLAHKIGMECDGASLGIALRDEVSGPLSVNLGVVRGDASGMSVQMNYRYPVTFTFEDCGPILRAAFETAGFRQTFIQHKAKIYMEPDSELVRKLWTVYSDYTGDTTPPKVLGGGTYAKMMPHVLAFGPVFPGDEVREHKPDEYMELSRLEDNCSLIAQAIYALSAE